MNQPVEPDKSPDHPAESIQFAKNWMLSAQYVRHKLHCLYPCQS